MIHKNPLPHIFVSVGHWLTAEQHHFVEEIDNILRTHGYAPITIGRTTDIVEHPLEIIRGVIAEAQGAIIIAFARIHIKAAIEYPDTPFAKSVAGWNLPTVWNQIEAAMAIQAKIPLLLLCEEGLHFEGIIDPQIHASIIFARASRNKVPENTTCAILDWLTEIP
jgi:hypothetical protein